MKPESQMLGKDPMMMYSDIPVNQYEYLRTLSDDELLQLYSKYQEYDISRDLPTDDQWDINDRVLHKDALIAVMNERNLDF